MKLSIVIVNYNVKYYLEQCLCSVYKAVDNLQAEVLVVDNASTDGSEAYLTGRFPQLTYIQNKANVGFARANNQAIRQATGEYVLLLNPDTLLPEDMLEQAVRFMDGHPRAGAAGAKMLTADGSFLPESKRGYPTLVATFGKLTGLGRLFPRSKGLGGYYCNGLDPDAVHRVEVLAGAFMLLRASALEKTGLLDEDFFMYGEDIDLSCRMAEAGYENYYLPYPMLHYKGESTSKDTYRHVRVFCGAMDIFFCKHGKRYGAAGRMLVRAGIRLQMYIRLSMLFLKLTLLSLKHALFSQKHTSLSSPKHTSFSLKHTAPFAGSKGAIRRKHPLSPRFLVFGEEAAVRSLRALFKRNGLTGRHHFVVSNETSSADGHGGMFISLEGFTHVVYDCRAFSFSTIIRLLSLHRQTGLRLGIYNPESRVLVTPEECYV